MPTTVKDVLKSVGLDDVAIDAMDAKVLEGFTGVLTAADTALLEAEKQKRAATDLFEKQITPALNEWGNKEANLAAERDYYKTLATKAKDGGFVAEVPPFNPAQPRNDQGQFVPGNTGSPTFDPKKFESRVSDAIGSLADLQWKYRSLFGGKEMPDSPTALAREAEAQRMDMGAWAARKYDFAGRETAIAKEAKAADEAAIRKSERELVTKELAERQSSNGDVSRGVVSEYASLRKGVTDGARPDPLKMTREQRHAANAAAIQADRAEMVN